MNASGQGPGLYEVEQGPRPAQECSETSAQGKRAVCFIYIMCVSICFDYSFIYLPESAMLM